MIGSLKSKNIKKMMTAKTTQSIKSEAGSPNNQLKKFKFLMNNVNQSSTKDLKNDAKNDQIKTLTLESPPVGHQNLSMRAVEDSEIRPAESIMTGE
jgi:hypothetical protein